MKKRILCVVLAMLLFLTFTSLTAFAKTENFKEIGTIEITESGDVIVMPMVAFMLSLTLVKSGSQYYATAKVESFVDASLSVYVYLEKGPTIVASASNSAYGTRCTTSTANKTLSAGTYRVYAAGYCNATNITASKIYTI